MTQSGHAAWQAAATAGSWQQLAAGFQPHTISSTHHVLTMCPVVLCITCSPIHDLPSPL
jgi:hypothetical protein